MIFILNNNLQVVGTLSKPGVTNKATAYFNDTLNIDLFTGAETFSFKTFGNSREAIHVEGGNYIALRHDGVYKLFQIVEVNSIHSTEHIKEAYCEMAGIELINEILRATNMPATNLKQALTYALQDTDYQIGYLDSSLTDVHSIELKEPTKVYNFLQNYIVGLFGAEISFSVEIQGNRVAGKYVNCHAQRGVFNGVRFEYGQNVTRVKKSVDYSELATALVCQGKNGTTISSVEEADKPLGQDWVGDENAYLTYSKNGQHIFDIFKFDTESPAELLREARKELANRCTPKFKYEVDVELLEAEVNIGDTVYVVDNEFNPPLHLSARVSQLQICTTDPTQSKCVLSNYKEVVSKITDDYRDLASRIDDKITNQEARLKTVESKTTDSAITNVVKQSQFIRDLEGNITEVDSKCAELKQTVDGFDFTGMVTFKDLSTAGRTIIDAGNITTGTVKGDLIRGGVIKGALLQTYSDDDTKGVRISHEAMQLNNTSFFYSTGGNFNIQSKEGFNIASMQNIYLMPGLDSSGTATGTGEVVIPNATTRVQKLVVVDNATISGNISGKGSILLGRTSMYLPRVGSSVITDYLRMGGGYLAIADTGAMHYVPSNGSTNMSWARGSVWLPGASGSVITDHFGLGFGIMACVDSGNFHFVTREGSSATIYAKSTVASYSLEEIVESRSNKSAIDIINEVPVVNTREGFRLTASKTKSAEATCVVRATVFEETGQENIKTDYNSALATLWKAVQELKEENIELKKLLNK